MPEPGGGGCLGDLGVGKRQLLKGWRPDLWLAGDKHDAPAGLRAPAADMAAAPAPPEPDQTLALPDALLLRVLACLPEPHLTGSASLVCRRWTRLAGRLRRRVAVRDWAFVAHRLPYRFPDLADLDLFPASIAAPTAGAHHAASAAPLLTCGAVSLTLDTSADPPLGACRFVDDDALDRGLAAVAASFPNLRRLSATAAAESGGLMAIAGGCRPAPARHPRCSGRSCATRPATGTASQPAATAAARRARDRPLVRVVRAVRGRVPPLSHSARSPASSPLPRPPPPPPSRSPSLTFSLQHPS